MKETIVCVGTVVRKDSRILLVLRVFDERHRVVPANPENPFAPHRAFI